MTVFPARHLLGLTLRQVRVYTGAGVTLVVIGALAHLVLPQQSDGPSGRGTSGVRHPLPQTQDPEAVARILKTVAGYSRDCNAETPRPTFRYPAIADAVGFARCIPTGAGARTLVVSRFSSDDQMNRHMDEYVYFLPRASGPCDAGPGMTTWRDRRNRRRGRIICGRDPNQSYVVWSDLNTRTTFSASGPDLRDLIEWWSKALRRQGTFPTPEETALRKAISSRVESGACVRDSTGGSPLSTASLVCPSPRGPNGRRLRVNALYFETFASSDDLNAHFETVGTFWAPTAGDDPNAFCGFAPSEREVWYDGAENRGSLLCWPSGMAQHIAWTDERTRLYGQLHRNDQSIQRTYEAWREVSGG